ncbi:DUF5011 domain-containing protein, partial [Listeria booriae]|uniref:immunoglobulin-like domain-containing protein n=1 Tax=Listeria booriae TaxID=1552123 RepID=UPI0017CCD7BF|nr:DUF5011 domain-containing protein [Listeria booriae]
GIGGTFENGNFTYYAQSQGINAGQNVYLVALDKNGKVLDRKPVQIQAPDTVGTINPLVYTEGDRNIKGAYTGDVKTVKLFVNGEYRGIGGTFENGNFTYYAQSQGINAGQNVYLVALDKNGKVLDRKPVQIEAANAEGTITPAEYTMGDASITGTYTGDVTYAKLKVNGKYVGNAGGTFENGEFEFYAKNKFKVTDEVMIEAYSSNYQLLDSEKVNVQSNIQLAGEFTEATYKTGDTSIKGRFTGDIEYAKIYINGTPLPAVGGDFNAGVFSFYVGKNMNIEAGDIVKIEGYNNLQPSEALDVSDVNIIE